MPSKKPLLRSGFTLIELLIVVAIIAILAAIAVPNFLEAQTRAKVSRVKADMRSIATAIESYRVDYNRLFPTFRPAAAQTRTWIFGYMTTPVAYFTSPPGDPFNKKDFDPLNRMVTLWGPDYLEGNRTIRYKDGVPAVVMPDTTTRSAIFFDPYPNYVQTPNSGNGGGVLTKRNFWVLDSWGPDQIFQVSDPVFASPVTPYDPTNGTISKGDIVRFSD
ncbi:MAG TPA: prepilin-type N-terminal cleavage/methylation domain-containing protein [Candidatus Sumerlaeota bacterium]|nr:prepilin-type N-terminal cleavage/methylation domain-containing protein [Candidatus Sumerlaeota bacterium]HNM47495.1 prepilin-type N-terminal cleavage/methylation domain-containing protein [Candidatus Sumerlaeota bacterium]